MFLIFFEEEARRRLEANEGVPPLFPASIPGSAAIVIAIG